MMAVVGPLQNRRVGLYQMLRHLPPAVYCYVWVCHPWLSWLVLVGVVGFLLDSGGMLMLAAIGGNSGSSVSFVEWT